MMCPTDMEPLTLIISCLQKKARPFCKKKKLPYSYTFAWTYIFHQMLCGELKTIYLHILLSRNIPICWNLPEGKHEQNNAHGLLR